jgi:hypothetical protein
VKRWGWAVLIALAGCGSLSNNEDGISTLELIQPPNSFLELDQSVQLRAVGRNTDGDSVGITIRWRTPDTAAVTLDSLTGLVTARLASGTARFQAAVIGSDANTPMVSDLGAITLTLTPVADTLQLFGDDSLEVAADDSVSAPLDARLLGGGNPVTGRPLRFHIVEPAFAATDSPTVRLSSGTITDSTMSSFTGGPNIPVLVRRVATRPTPDRVVVEATARRASGDLIPGSGLRFVIRFANP